MNGSPGRRYTIRDIFAAFPVTFCSGNPGQCTVRAVTSDSRRVRPGDLFIAKKGEQADGTQFIDAAIANGAVRIIAEKAPPAMAGTMVYGVVKDARAAAVHALNVMYGDPSQQMNIIGITGTNGKTTTAFLLQHLLGGRLQAGVIGTVYADTGKERIPLGNTTPDQETVVPLLREMSRAGAHACVMEVSSHAVVQRRIEGIRFGVKIFTNLTQDHLDYHGTMESYYAAKERFFIPSGPAAAVALINIDDPYGRRLYGRVAGEKYSYGSSDDADWRITDSQVNLDAITAQVATPDGPFSFTCPLVCTHNIYNVVAASLAAQRCGIPLNVIAERLRTFPGVAGRMERVPAAEGTVVFIDYAHTPDAVEHVLRSVRSITDKKIITVFGCGGDRDRLKRPRMGALAAALSDHVIVTNDNPRTEDPAVIVRDICAGMDGAAPYEIIYDREQAIERGYEKTCAVQGILLVLGKGHEQYQIRGTEKTAFSDRAVIEKLVREKEPI